jgi:hypothetical protein
MWTTWRGVEFVLPESARYGEAVTYPGCPDRDHIPLDLTSDPDAMELFTMNVTRATVRCVRRDTSVTTQPNGIVVEESAP